ncbi:N-acetylglucosamine kinase [Paenibacillus sp. CMAA1364]
MSYYLGVDGGGTKTYALLTDEYGNVLGKGKSGNGNHQMNVMVAENSIEEATRMAMLEAGIELSDISHAYFGLAGADREADYMILHPLIRNIGFTKYTINCDTMIGLRAGTNKPFGISIICGTGTNAAGRNSHGVEYQCGGFSYMYGDFGGGGSLNIEVFRSVIRAWDGREQPTLLTQLLLQHLGYETVEEMFNDYQDHHKRDVPVDVSRLLFEAAAQEDAVALEILNHQGVELGKSAVAIVRKLSMSSDIFDVVLVGSLLTRGDRGWIRGPIESALRTVAPQASVVTLTTEPVVGALWSAMEVDGLTINVEVYERMRYFTDFEAIQ